MLICSNESTETLENAIYIADIGIMLGRNVNVFVDGNECDLLTSVASVLSKSKGKLVPINVTCPLFIYLFYNVENTFKQTNEMTSHPLKN